MANRNWDELNKAAKAATIAKITIIGAVGVAAIVISKKAITKFTAEAITDVIKPLMNDDLTDLEAENQ